MTNLLDLNDAQSFNTNMTHLLELNDDCLNIMFALKYLTISDLCSVAQTCTRLKSIANDIFKLKHNIYKIVSSPSTTAETTQLLCNFGSLITHLSIEPTSPNWIDMATVASVIRYCSGTLQSLKIEHYGIPVKQTSGLRSLFKKLKKLHIHDIFIKGTEEDEEFDTWKELKTKFPNLRNFFGNCESLVELKVIDCEDLKAVVFENTFPKLEHFKYDFADGYIGSCNLENFVSRHKSLKTFSLTSDEDYISLLPVIAVNCTQLESLKFTATEGGTPVEKALMSLLSLQNLKKLKLCCSFENVTKFIQELRSMNSLEILHLSHVRGDLRFIPALSQLKKLRVLKLEECDPLKDINPLGELKELNELVINTYKGQEVECDVVSIIKRLQKLNYLQIYINGFAIGKSTYLKIVDVVHGRQSEHQHTLQILCGMDDDLKGSREYGDNSHIVEIKY